MVWPSLENPDSGPLSDGEKALLHFVRKLNNTPAQIGPPDIAPLHALHVTDEAIYDAVSVCSLFNFYNRWIDGTGVHAHTMEQHRASAARMAKGGYVRTS